MRIGSTQNLPGVTGPGTHQLKAAEVACTIPKHASQYSSRRSRGSLTGTPTPDGFWGRENQLSLVVWFLVGQPDPSRWPYTQESVRSTIWVRWVSY